MHKHAMPAGRQGFVLAELIVVIGIMAVFFGIIYIRATNIERRTPLPSLINSLIADMRSQQTKAMSGEAVSGLTDNYGVHFQTNQYTLFRGSSYNAADPTNSVIQFPDTVTLVSITFPNAVIVFSKGSGDVVGYSDGTNTVTIGESGTGDQRIVTLNQYGAVTSVQ